MYILPSNKMGATWDIVKESGTVVVLGGMAIAAIANWVRGSELAKFTNERVNQLESRCVQCRQTVEEHHQDSSIHVTDAYADTMKDMYERVRRIESLLMRWNGGSSGQ